MEQIENIRILTYNLFLRPPLIKNNDDDYKQERLDEFYQIMHNYDIICLQEVFDLLSDRKQKLIKKAMKSGYLWYADNENPSFLFSKFLTDGGLLVLSKFPIVYQQFYPYKYGYLADGIAMKGAIYCKIRINNHQYLHLYNTHLQAQYYGLNQDQLKYCVQTKLQQMHELKQNILINFEKYQYQPNDQCLLVGDLNIDARNQENVRHLLQDDLFEKNIEISEYDALFHLFQREGIQITDCLRQRYQYSPITYGDVTVNYLGDEIPKETDLCLKDDYCSKLCLDYIIQLVPQQLLLYNYDKSKNNEILKINIQTTQVQEFKSTQRKPKYLSDHYGVEIQLTQ